MEQKLFLQIEDLGGDPQAIRWCKAREIRPQLSEAMNYTRNRDTTLNSEKILKIWEIVDKHRAIFEVI